MTLKELQAQVDGWVGQWKDGYWHPLANVVRLAEEVGELAREVNHRFGPKTKKPTEDKGDLALEMGDILFIVACIANSQGIDLEQAFRATMEKYRARDNSRWARKEADE